MTRHRIKCPSAEGRTGVGRLRGLSTMSNIMMRAVQASAGGQSLSSRTPLDVFSSSWIQEIMAKMSDLKLEPSPVKSPATMGQSSSSLTKSQPTGMMSKLTLQMMDLSFLPQGGKNSNSSSSSMSPEEVPSSSSTMVRASISTSIESMVQPSPSSGNATKIEIGQNNNQFLATYPDPVFPDDIFPNFDESFIEEIVRQVGSSDEILPDFDFNFDKVMDMETFEDLEETDEEASAIKYLDEGLDMDFLIVNKEAINEFLSGDWMLGPVQDSFINLNINQDQDQGHQPSQ